jgi:hypothetical protein
MGQRASHQRDQYDHKPAISHSATKVLDVVILKRALISPDSKPAEMTGEIGQYDYRVLMRKNCLTDRHYPFFLVQKSELLYQKLLFF